MDLVSNECVNSHWVAKWLAKPDQECCECPYECKVTVQHENGYRYVVTEEEFKRIKQ